MIFYHGTSIENFEKIKGTSKLESEWILNDIYKLLTEYQYDCVKCTYLTPQYQIAKKYATKNNKNGVILFVELEFDCDPSEYEIMVFGKIDIDNIKHVEFL